MRKYKKTNRKINKKKSKTKKARKSRKYIKHKFKQFGGNRACLDALQEKYGQVFWTGGITTQQIYDDALNIRQPEVIDLIRHVRERILTIKIEKKFSSVYSAPNKAEVTRLICLELEKITNMLGEERSRNIFRPTLRFCSNYKSGILGEYNSPHYKFLLEYLDCLINIMEFSLLQMQAPALGIPAPALGIPAPEQIIRAPALGIPAPDLEAPAPGGPGWVAPAPGGPGWVP
jgi:hypothetical protein